MVEIATHTYETSRSANSGIKMRDIIYILFRRRWIILAISLPITIMGGLSIFSQTGQFTASANVLVQLSEVDLPRWNITGRNIDYDRELSTLYNMAMSVPVAQRAALTLTDSIPVILTLDPSLVDLTTPLDLQDFLLMGLDVSVVGESSILQFSFSSAHPRISLMAVGALRDAFVDYKINGLKNPHAINYYAEQLNTVRSEIDSLLDLRADVMQKHGYISFKDDLKHMSGQIADLQNQLMAASVNRRTLEIDHNALLSFLDDDPRAFPMGADENRSITLVYWRNMVSKHEDQLNSILTIHTDQSIPAERQRTLLKESLTRLRQEELTYVKSIGMALNSARERESALAEQLRMLRKSTADTPIVYQKISLLDTEITSVRGLLKSLQGKLGEVRLAQLADERISSVELLNVPELTAILSGGKTVVYFVMLVFMGFTLGIVIAFVIDSFDHRIYSPSDVEDSLQLPMFASISKVD